MPSTSAPKALKWIALCLALACSLVRPQHYTATYTPNDTPVTSEKGQFGTNQCGTGTFQDSLCQNAFFNSLEDFCLWAPPYSNGKNATIGETEVCLALIFTLAFLDDLMLLTEIRGCLVFEIRLRNASDSSRDNNGRAFRPNPRLCSSKSSSLFTTFFSSLALR